MRKFVCLLLVLFYAASAADAGIMPKRGKRRKHHNSGYVGNAITSRGPQYSAPDAPPSPSQIPGLIAAGDPNSPNQVAAQSMGLAAGGDCNGVQARAQSLLAQINALTAQLQDLQAKQQAELTAIYSCPVPGPPLFDSSCQDNHSAQAQAYANQALSLVQQAIPWGIELQGLQAKQASCSSSGGSSAQAMPPGVTWAALGQRLGANMGGDSDGHIGGSAGDGLAMQQLEKLASEGEAADWDGRNPGMKKLTKALNHYGNASKRASYVGRLVNAGKLAAKTNLRSAGPADIAQAEYLKINYKELGPKYAALAEERHQAADDVAAQTLSGLSGPAPLPDMEGGSEIKLDESKALSLGGAGAYVDKAAESLGEGMKDAVLEKLPLQWQSLEKIIEIHLAVGKVWDLRDDLMAAVNEMGSGSQSTASTESLLAKLDKYFGDVKDATYESNPFKTALGAD